MRLCYVQVCKDCTCGRLIAAPVCANDNHAPVQQQRVRRDPVAAAKAIEARFKESMKILS